MEAISMRELVAWVVILGLVVTLVSSKMKVRQMSLRKSAKKPSKRKGKKVKKELPTLEMTDEEAKAVKELEAELAFEETWGESQKMGGDKE